jgi:site-specific DNA recombinase
MSPKLTNNNAIGAIRVSTDKQGRDGDSPEDQQNKIAMFAAARGMEVREYFAFMESGSKTIQPMQSAIDFCKDPKNNIQFLIIKSIDRFTRGGSRIYEDLKTQLDDCGVVLIDTYGIISSEKINTLDHLGFQYKWSVFSPSQKSELMEAERAKDELRDIMSRLISAEIRYTQMGYWMRRAPYGFISEKVETKQGKRMILKPHPTESKYVITMFDMRIKGFTDKQIVEKVNILGFATRVQYKRDPKDRTKVIKKTGGKPLTVKAMQQMLLNPIYAGVNVEKWTNYRPVHCAFKGLISVETFNRAHKGKKMIIENDEGDLQVTAKRPPEHLVDKGRRNPEFPFRKHIMCPECGDPLSASSSRGRNGKYYPAYHCAHRGHYYRIPKEKLEASVANFVHNLQVPQERLDFILDTIRTEWNLRNQGQLEEIQGLTDRIAELQQDVANTLDKIRVLSSPTTIKFMEDDLVRIEKQIKDLTAEKERKEAARPADLERILARARHFVENLDELIIKQIDPVKKARFFRAIFDRMPSSDDLDIRNTETPLFTGVNQFFQLLKNEGSPMVH